MEQVTNIVLGNSMKTAIYASKKQGFALVVTISLLILLTMIAVGILTLSTISLRSSSQTAAMGEARANARMALMLALGDLQKTLGPDRAVTATSEILATSAAAAAKPNTTGVWESWWDFNPSSSPVPNYASEKTTRFRRWLVSDADRQATESQNFATSPWVGNVIELVGNRSLGSNNNPAARVSAGVVPVSQNGRIAGSYAWHVADESVKARVNLYRDPRQNTTLAQKRALLAGQRPVSSVIKGPDGVLLNILPTDIAPAEFVTATSQSGKITDLDQAELLAQAAGRLKPLRNDITTHSRGVMADARNGGLKQDLSSIFEMGSATATPLPPEFSGRKLYQSTHGITGVSDPNWSALSSYYNSFRNLIARETNPTLALRNAAAVTNTVPTTYNPAPVIAKVDTIFSLVARPTSDVFWINGNAQVRDFFDYHLNLIFTPVVTLHNPYNVNISFHRMEVSFENIPVSFNIMFQAGGTGGFVSQGVVPNVFESINTMSYSGAEHNGRREKIFVMNIANWADDDPIASSSSVTGPIVMRPGQTLVCGPRFPANSSFKSDSGSGHNTVGFDWDNRLTRAIKARPSFVPGLGYEMYAIAIAQIRKPGGVFPGGWSSHPFMMLRGNANPKLSKSTVTDNFYVEFRAQQPGWYRDDTTTNRGDANPSFAVTAKLQANEASSFVDYARLQFDYTNDTTLRNFFDNRVYRYPPTGSLTAFECAAPGGTPYSSQGAFVHPFALISAYSRTTSGGVYETGKRSRSGVDSPQLNLLKDGRLAGIPFLFHNPSRGSMIMNLATDKPGSHSYELNLQPFLSKGDFQDYMDVEANRVPALTGNKTLTGIKSGSYLEIPSGPMQTIADFRRSNALTTTFLPHFVQPVSNSRLHPLMAPNRVVETNPSLSATALLDHSVLANHALYDRFYFSSFATRGSVMPNAVFEQFMNGVAPLASQAFEPYLPSGGSVATARAELFASGRPNANAFKLAAEYQMIRGPFNVNSTSVQAWKAVLASMNRSDISTLWARNSTLENITSAGTPIPSMSLPNGGANRTLAVNGAKIDNERSNDWNGYRQLTEPELENLAVKIVDEVRNRGPFLSMSEFVNRQVGPVGPLTLAGALETAITQSEINERINAVAPESFLDQVPVTAADVSDPKLYNYRTPAATTGNPAAGAPGWVNQGDLMRILEPGATVRGDTFVIRSYGDAKDANGAITARAYAEAVVQRIPEYLDPTNRPSVNAYSDPLASATNRVFGRRINVVSFRWLSPNEI